MKPKLFVGSSREALNIANAVHENLRDDAEVTVWNQGIFNLSESAVDSLLDELNSMDFGVFIFAPDDVVNIRGKENRATRDNVIFELGLYIGRLGRPRSFIFLPSEQDDFRLPTDVVGMTPATYESDRSDDNFVSATAVACNQARRRISQLESSSEPDAPTIMVHQEDERSAGMRSLDAKETKEFVAQDEETDDKSWEQAYDNRDYTKAIELLQERIESADEEENKRFLELQLGRVKASLDFDEGIKYLEDKIEEQPSDGRGYFMLAWTYENNELYDESLAVLDRGLESATVKNPLSWLKAVQLSTVGDVDEAKTILRKLIDDDPRYESAYNQLTRILIAEDEKDEAKEVYESGLKALPNDEDLLSGYAALLSDLEKNESTLAVYTKLNNLYPDKARYFSYLGNAYLNLDLYGLALEAYEKADEIAEGKESWILGNIGNLYNNKGLHPKAVSMLKKALRLDPDSAYAADRLSKAIKEDQEERKKANKIIQEHKRATRSKPTT